jgi:hypothetical protein
MYKKSWLQAFSMIAIRVEGRRRSSEREQRPDKSLLTKVPTGGTNQQAFWRGSSALTNLS